MRYRGIGWVAGTLYSVCAFAGGEQSVVSLDSISVQASQEENIVGGDAASSGTVSAEQLKQRPVLRPAEVLETVPGLIVTQHSGDGKANQYFLRGFSLDHGTDFYTTIEGMPTNLPTHAHGQGYNDLNFLIPELISDIVYTKGPYYAAEGDFASTGSAHIRYADSVENGTLSLGMGSDNRKRFLNIDSFDVGGGKLLYALEYFYNDGPWEHSEGYERFNGLVSFSKDHENLHYKITAMAYNGTWDATNHVPLRAIDNGTIGRYGTLDPSDGGKTHRYSLSGNLSSSDRNGVTTANAYVIDYGLDLFSNFTYYLNDPIHGDQFEQKDSRTILGGSVNRTSVDSLGNIGMLQTYGIQFRHDAIDGVSLYNTDRRLRIGTVSSDRVDVSALGLYYQNDIALNEWIRMIPGIRADTYRFSDKSLLGGESRSTTTGMLSPKLSCIFGPWNKTEYFINAGYGFHSNDARGVNAQTSPATPLVRTKGAEIGMRTRALESLQSSLSVWTMHSDSELVFAGDSGGTEATGPARRIGIEWANYWTPAPWFILDADVAFSRARYTDAITSGGKYVPEAMEKVVSLGAVVNDYEGWFAGARLRYFGSRALIEDNTVRSDPSVLVNVKVGHRLSHNSDLSLDVYNLFDRKTYDIEYYYASQMAKEITPVADYMVHPGEPRSFRLTYTLRY